MPKRTPRAEKVGEELIVPIELITRFKDQPREYFDEEELLELGGSMKAIGQLVPVQVKKLPSGRFELIAGERRLRAAKLVGLPALRATTRPVRNREDQYLKSAVENIGRAGYTPQETVNIIVSMLKSKEVERIVTREKRERLKDEAGKRRKGRRPSLQATESDKIEWIARTLGQSQAWAYSYLALRRLDRTVFRRIKPLGQTGGLTFSTAKDLAGFVPEDKPLQRRIAEKIDKGNLSNLEARNLMRQEKVRAGYGLDRTDSRGRSTKHSSVGRLVRNVIGRTQRETSLLLDLADETISEALDEFSDEELKGFEQHITASMSRLRKLQMMVKNRKAKASNGRARAAA